MWSIKNVKVYQDFSVNDAKYATTVMNVKIEVVGRTIFSPPGSVMPLIKS